MVIKHILKKKGMKYADLAERLGVHSSAVSKWLVNPTEETVKKIAKALDLEPWQLYLSDWEMMNKLEDLASSDMRMVTCPHCGKRIPIVCRVMTEVIDKEKNETK